MGSLRSALASVRDLLDWLPDSVVAVLLIAIAVLIAAALHKWVRKLVRRMLATRYPFLFSIFTQMRGLTRFALFIFALSIAIPVAPMAPEAKA
jgi:predicted neutral ceramidase superfamily lipid hydrolase